MPAGYLKLRDEFVRQGMSLKAAQAKAAAIWNSQHPDNPVGAGYDKKKGKKR